jgi:drug/metabolite transporter (DMT)-like permease
MKRWSTADLMMIYVVLVWGSIFTVIKWITVELPIETANAFRFLLIIPSFLLILLWRRDLRLSGRDLFLVTVLGVFGFGFYQILSSYGISLAVIAGSSLILASTPIFTTLFSGTFGVESIDRWGWLGVAVGLVGISIIVFGEHGMQVLEVGSITGELAMITSAACWAAGAVISKPLMQRHSSMKITSYSSVIGSALMLPFVLPGIGAVDWKSIGIGTLLLVLYWVFIGNIIGQLVRFHCVKQIGPHRATVYIYLVPFTAAIFGAVLIGSPVGLHHLVGGVVIFTGVALTRVSPEARTQRTPRLAP